MFGRYFHAMMTHAASMYRLVALRSLNTEMQVRPFNLCNDITKTTSNRQSSNLINNIIIRVQQESDGSTTTMKKQEGEVTTLAAALKPPSNTVVTKEWVQNHPYLWQAHLERITDYLVHGPGGYGGSTILKALSSLMVQMKMTPSGLVLLFFILDL